ncbi:MAG: outer membrane lipoprotein-sorting protein [Saprospiraceae bacterium]|nr:outer membrane lipoprotein-sorting protein [Saprospiraceae bacterium]
MKHIISLLFFIPSVFLAQDATEIIRRSDKKLRGEQSYAELKMTIVRPDWERTMGIKSWSMGEKYAVIYITSPARDRGTAFLKRDNEIWNWQPKINRSIKLPPSMMMQSWMGSDFTNDDLVKESSIVSDYSHELIGKEEVEGRMCYKIKLTPKPSADVVWGSINTWIDVEDYMQLKTEFYDEDGYLINTMRGSDIETLGGKKLPSKLVITPEEEEGHKTIVEYKMIDFDPEIDPSFFSIQSMKRIR